MQFQVWDPGLKLRHCKAFLIYYIKKWTATQFKEKAKVSMEHIAPHMSAVYFQKKIGVLHYRYNEIQKALFFQDGQLIFAKTNQESELLGEVLHQLGKITDDMLTKIEEFIEPMRHIGGILVKKEVISSEDLSEGLRHQMREIALNIFPIFGGSFKLVEKNDFGPQPFEAALPIPILIEDGIRRMRFHPQLKEFFAEKPLFPRRREFVHRLTEDEKKILSGIGMRRTAEDIQGELRLPPEMYWKSLFLMFCLDIIGFEEYQTQEPKAPAAMDHSASEPENLKAVLELHQRLESLNYYQVLEIPKNASANDVKKAYFSLARLYHPDLFDRGLSTDLRDKIADVFDILTKAYRTLSDEIKREAYNARRGGDSEGGEKKDGIKQADVKFRQGKTLFNQARYEDAVVYLEQAVRQKTDQSSYHLLLAMSYEKIPGNDVKAEEHFLKAIKLEPWNAEAYVGLGMLYKQGGLRIKAAKFFKKALAIDDSHRVAKRELAEIEKPKSKSMWKDLLKGDILGKSRKK